jgi:hypothetical protein
VVGELLAAVPDLPTQVVVPLVVLPCVGEGEHYLAAGGVDAGVSMPWVGIEVLLEAGEGFKGGVTIGAPVGDAVCPKPALSVAGLLYNDVELAFKELRAIIRSRGGGDAVKFVNLEGVSLVLRVRAGPGDCQ